MRKIIFFCTIVLAATMMLGFVSSKANSEPQNEIVSKAKPLTGAEKSGYSESNRASL